MSFCFTVPTHLFVVFNIKRIMIYPRLLNSEHYDRARIFHLKSEIRVKFISLCCQKALMWMLLIGLLDIFVFFFSMIAIKNFINRQVFTFFLLHDFREKNCYGANFQFAKKLVVKSQMQSDVSSCLNLQSSCRSNLAWVKPAEYLHDYIKHFKSKFTSNQKT